MYQYKCPNCGKPFQGATKNRVYCSRTCVSQAFQVRLKGRTIPESPERRQKQAQTQRTSPKFEHKQDFVCDNCGKTFSEYPKRRPKQLKFCDRECGLNYQRNHSKGHVGNMDLDSAAPPKLGTPGMTIVLENGELKNR
jgi:endogenous inhibitor of DNA gyrase (YacG/DUF329 family)